MITPVYPQRIRDLTDEVLLGFGDNAIAFGGSNSRRQIGTVHLLARLVGDAESRGQLFNGCAFLIVDMVIVAPSLGRQGIRVAPHPSTGNQRERRRVLTR